jgi:hypothetical protein
MNLSAPWHTHPLVGISLNPVRGHLVVYNGFVDLAIVRRHQGVTETVVDCRTRASDEEHNLGSFSPEEMARFRLEGFGYAQEAKPVGPILAGLHKTIAGCVPVAVNPTICRNLVHRAVRLAEGAGTHVNTKNVFLLRPMSRWIDLGLWRIQAEIRRVDGAEPFGGLSLSPRDRVVEALDRLPVLARSLEIPEWWTLKELLGWQNDLIPF